MSDKSVQQAIRADRVAILPAFLAVGCKIWYWRELLCGDDICPEGVTAACPVNRGVPWFEDEARECACRHPTLEGSTVWSVGSYFTPRGIEWVINDLPAVADCYLRGVFFKSREEAEAARPGRIVHG